MQNFRETFAKTATLIDEGTTLGLHAGAQLYISVKSDPVANWATGVARQGIDMTPETVMPWLSSGKPLGAIGIGRLVDMGVVELDERVGAYIPEFAVRGKEAITVRQLLTHTGGFRAADYILGMGWDQILERICGAALEPRWVPGETAGYHPETSWYVLGEIIRRVDPGHRDFATFMREEIFEPVGMEDCWFVMDGETCASYAPRLGSMRFTMGPDERTFDLHEPAQCGFYSPGASARGPVSQLGMFYEMLLRGGRTVSGTQLISAETVKTFTSRQRTGTYDLTFKHIVDWGLGFIVNSARYGEQTVPYGYGLHASPETFGHGGRQSSVGMADPARGLVIALVFNGMPGDLAHQNRVRSVLSAIYEDLGMA
ncbi:MAG: beta-lactamase family protein [Planctomycetota bacterium]|nr:beta-lactamase family protein [Planctomycetota bacterium]